MPTESSENHFAQALQHQKKNSLGFLGALLSILQFFIHGLWLSFAAALGDAANLPAGSWQYWVILVLMVLGVIVTMAGLFISLAGLKKGSPRTFAAIGFCLCFFVGATSFCVVVIGYVSKG